MENKWLLQYLDNYHGTSPEAKALEKEIQKNYKGNAYIGWATMERLTYQQDPNATFEVILGVNETPLFTLTNHIVSDVKAQDKITYSGVDSIVNFVRVKLTFLGRTFIEDYPVQAKDYSAPKFVDSNDVNKAVQRAKAKVASRGTGLALKLYEGNDLQFDAPDTNVINKAIPKPVQEVLKNNTTEEIAKQILDNFDELLNGIKQVNTALLKKFAFTIEPNDTVETLSKKLSKVPNVELTLNQIKRMAKENV
jgi:hypothetical protein